jgi:hypothetical protein
MFSAECPLADGHQVANLYNTNVNFSRLYWALVNLQVQLREDSPQAIIIIIINLSVKQT